MGKYKQEEFDYNYVPDKTLNLREARKNLIVKCLRDFSDKKLEYVSKRLGLSIRELHREMVEMKIIRRFNKDKYEVYD